LSGVTLALKDAWEVPATHDLARLIRACGEMPPGSVLYLEDGAAFYRAIGERALT
jgi:hypothetical protein